MDEEKSLIEIPRELTVNQVVEQINKVKELMKAVMKDGEHYGVIPGTKKPSLYKSGAEKLGTLFRLRPHYEVEHISLENNHREYRVVCKLYHIPTGNIISDGCGSCSTMESKYRYRHEDDIVGQVPKEYWDLRGDNPQGAQALIGVGNRTKKIDGQWTIIRAGDRIENPDIADVYNTSWKMACKRAHVAAMLTACAASDIFTQDLEDFQGTAKEKAAYVKSGDIDPFQEQQEVKAEVIDDKPVATPPKEEKKCGKLSREELLKRSESVAKLMLENGTVNQTEFDQMAKHTTQISEDYQQLYDSYKALCLKYKKELAESDRTSAEESAINQTKETEQDRMEKYETPSGELKPDFNQDLPGGIY